MALGIDSVAHRATLDADGQTIAVLGTGVDVAYPRAHVALHREIAEKGLLLSELAPGAKSHKGSFPNRNRIIAGLSRVVIIAEAPMQSGALITANHALDLGRDIAVIPGPIDSPHCAGSNELLRNGAHPIVSIADAIALAGLTPQRRTGPVIADETEMRIWRALEKGAASLDELCVAADLPVARCLAAVTGLELRGAVECALTGEIRRR
jgi:DNA processing protein